MLRFLSPSILWKALISLNLSDDFLIFDQRNIISREGIWTWSNSYNVEVNTSVYSEIWTPNTDVGNPDDCVVMTVGNNSQLAWKDIPCLEVDFDGKPIQVLG